MRIDPHVHFRDEEESYKETIAHGLQLASQAGIDIVFDMPNLAKPLLREKDVKRRLGMVPKESLHRYCMYIGATKDAEQLKEAVSVIKKYPAVIGMKMYAGKSTGNLAILKEETQERVYATLAKLGYEGVLAVHCEKESRMTNTFNPKNPISHARSRPNITEIESIQDQIRFVKKHNFKGTLHIAHLSCKDALPIIKQARKEGIKVTCGVTPHHLLWNEQKLNEKQGLLYKTNPPLRSQEDVDGLIKGIQERIIDWIETDHAPHTTQEKLHDGYPSGYPSLNLYKELIETFLPQKGINKERIEELTSTNIVKTFKL